MIFLYVLLIIIAVLIGITCYQFLKKRYLFYKELVDFLDYYKENLLYYQNSISNIIDKASSNYKEIGELLVEYNNKKNNENLSLRFPQYIQDPQKEQILNIFEALGFGDAETELYKTEIARNEILEQRERFRAAYDKYGVLSIKLGVLFGFLLVILLL